MVSSSPVKGLAAAFLVLLMGAATPAIAAEVLVLIVSARSEVDKLDATEAQRIFVGLTVTRGGVRLRPILNESDPQIQTLFLQQIVSMTASTYDRYILRLALLQGRTEPAVFHDIPALINAVATDPTAVGYVWAKDVERDPRVRIVRIVWQH